MSVSLCAYVSAKKCLLRVSFVTGNYYTCPPGTEPDLDAYRVQANMHERKCTFGKKSEPVALDPCIDAEVAPIEYSFHEGWMFCLGNGERENNYFMNGALDCGNKTKVSNMIIDHIFKCFIKSSSFSLFDVVQNKYKSVIKPKTIKYYFKFKYLLESIMLICY